MQVPRYWRMKQHLYRLNGYQNPTTGQVTLTTRLDNQEKEAHVVEQPMSDTRKKMATVA